MNHKKMQFSELEFPDADVIIHSELNSTVIAESPHCVKNLEKNYSCLYCGKIFLDDSLLQNHQKSHKDNSGSYTCNICGKIFSVPARLTRHYRTHTGEKPYECEYCKKSFSVKENLSVHRRIHTKERPYRCDICDRAFEHSGKLHRHMRIHTGERPHRCLICDKTFIQSGQLVIHMRTHTGEKPYKCKCCGKGFTCSKQLKVHTRTHTGEKPYSCEICGKSFGYNHVLKLHQVAHYGEKIYKCTICHEIFNSKKIMESHIKKHSENGTPGFQGNISEKLTEEFMNDHTAHMSVELNNIIEILNEKTSRSSPQILPNPHSYTTGNSNVATIGQCNKSSIISKSVSSNHNSKIMNISDADGLLCVNGVENKYYGYNYARFPTLHKTDNEIGSFGAFDNRELYKNQSKGNPQAIFNMDLDHSSGNPGVIKNFDRENDCLIEETYKLPPRKRCKMILESMKIEESKLIKKQRCNSVIRYARGK